MGRGSSKHQTRSRKVRNSHFDAAVLLLIKMFWKATKILVADLTGADGFRTFPSLNAGQFLDAAEEKGYITKAPGQIKRSFVVNKQNRKVQEIAVRLDLLPGPTQARKLIANMDTDALHLLQLEMVRVVEVTKSAAGWLPMTNGASDMICTYFGWKRRVGQELFLEIMFGQLVTEFSDLFESRKIDDQICFRAKIAMTREEAIAVLLPSPPSPPISALPPPDMAAPADKERKEQVQGAIEVGERPPVATTSSTNPPMTPAAGVAYAALSRSLEVQMLLLSFIWEIAKNGWVASAIIRKYLTGRPGWNQATYQGIGKMIGWIRDLGLIESEGEHHSRRYRLTREGAQRVLHLNAEELEKWFPNTERAPEPLAATIATADPPPAIPPAEAPPPPPPLPESVAPEASPAVSMQTPAATPEANTISAEEMNKLFQEIRELTGNVRQLHADLSLMQERERTRTARSMADILRGHPQSDWSNILELLAIELRRTEAS